MRRLHPGHIDELMSILTCKKVIGLISDDGFKSDEDLKCRMMALLENLSVYVLSPRENAVMLFIPMNHIMYDIHITTLSGNYKKDAYSCLLWMVENTNAKKFIGMIPSCNSAAVAFACKSGMIKEGVLKDAFQRNNKIYNLDIYGATDKMVLAKRR